MNDPKNHVTAYDIIRIIAALLVVLGHSTYLTITTNSGAIDYHLPANIDPVYRSDFFKTWHYLSAWVYRFHVALFFMLAGSVYALNPITKLKNLLKKKSYRLLLPFLLTGLFFMIPLKTLGNFFDPQQIPTVILNFLTGHESGHLWFLTSLFWCFLVFWGLKNFLKNNFLLLLVTFLIYLFHDLLPEGYFDFAFSMQFLFFFAAGYCFETVRTFFEKHRYLIFCLFPCLILLNILDTQKHFLPAVGFTLAGCALVYNLAFCLTALFKDAFNRPFFRLSANQTMIVYLLHDPLMIVILYLCMQKELLTSAVGCWIYFFCRTIGVVLLSVFIGIIIKKGIAYAKSFINYRRPGFQCHKSRPDR